MARFPNLLLNKSNTVSFNIKHWLIQWTQKTLFHLNKQPTLSREVSQWPKPTGSHLELYSVQSQRWAHLFTMTDWPQNQIPEVRLFVFMPFRVIHLVQISQFFWSLFWRKQPTMGSIPSNSVETKITFCSVIKWMCEIFFST